MIFHRASNQKGFSLIEVIVIIVISAVAFSMMAVYFGSFMTESSAPIHRLTHAMELKQVAERITEPYRKNPSGSLAPKHWALDNSPGIYGQNFTVVYNEYVKFTGQNDTAISFGDPEDMLKVKIRHDTTKETITLLFIRQNGP